jgi:hypothetical protein
MGCDCIKSGVEMSLAGAFTIIEGVAPDFWVNITGRGKTLFNIWQTYTINYPHLSILYSYQSWSNECT